MNLLPFVTLARDENPKPLLTADEVAMCLYRAASLAQAAGHDVGVLLKPHGAGGMSPVGRISLDIMIDIPDEQEYDAFKSADGENGAPGPAIPVWHKLPFKVGVPPSGASMDRVRRPAGAVLEPEPVPVPPTPEPVPVPDPNTDVPDSRTPNAPCKAVESMAEVLDALHEMRIEQAERDEAIRTLLYRLINAERMPRRLTGKAGWMSLSGQVDGVPVE